MPFRFNYSTGTIKKSIHNDDMLIIIGYNCSRRVSTFRNGLNKTHGLLSKYGRCKYPWESMGLYQESTSEGLVLVSFLSL